MYFQYKKKIKGEMLEKCSTKSTKQNPPLDWPLKLL